jgi:hypothetical protein
VGRDQEEQTDGRREEQTAGAVWVRHFRDWRAMGQWRPWDGRRSWGPGEGYTYRERGKKETKKEVVKAARDKDDFNIRHARDEPDLGRRSRAPSHALP